MQSENKRQLIIQASQKVFSAFSYDDAKIAHIAQEARIGDGTVYSYFASKSEIAQALADEILQQNISRIRERNSSERSWKKKMCAAVRGRFEICAASPLLFRLIFEEIRSRRSFYHSEVTAIFSRYDDFIIDIIREGHGSGEIRHDISSDLIKDMLYGLADRQAFSQLRLGVCPTPGDAERIVEIVLRGLLVENIEVGRETSHLVVRLENVAETLIKRVTTGQIR